MGDVMVPCETMFDLSDFCGGIAGDRNACCVELEDSLLCVDLRFAAGAAKALSANVSVTR